MKVIGLDLTKSKEECCFLLLKKRDGTLQTFNLTKPYQLLQGDLKKVEEVVKVAMKDIQGF